MLENAQREGLRLKDGWRERLNPNPLGQIHESRTGFWRLWRPVVRKIPEGAKIHGSVLKRLEADKSYKPRLPGKYAEGN
jgi:hypothetical protein